MKSIWAIRTLATLGIVISGCLLTTAASAQPYEGGLPQCLAERDQCIAEKNQCQTTLTACDTARSQCQTNLAACNTEKNQLQATLTACDTARSQCQTNLAACNTELQACQDGACDSDADCPTGNACVNNLCTLRLPYCSDDPNTLTPGSGRYIVTSDLLTINCLPYRCFIVSLSPSSQFALCTGGSCQSTADCYFEAGYVCSSDGRCVPKP